MFNSRILYSDNPKSQAPIGKANGKVTKAALSEKAQAHIIPIKNLVYKPEPKTYKQFTTKLIIKNIKRVSNIFF